MVLIKVFYLVIFGTIISSCEAFGNLPTLINNTENNFIRIKNSIYKCLDYYTELEMVTESMYGAWDRVDHHISFEMGLIKSVASNVIVDIKAESSDTFVDMLTVSTNIINKGNKIANRTISIIAHPLQDILHSAITMLDVGGFPIVAAVQIIDFLDSVDNRLHEINNIFIMSMKMVEKVLSNMLRIACREPDKIVE